MQLNGIELNKDKARKKTTNLFSDSHQHKLELHLRGHSPGALVADVFQRGGDVDLLGALRHAVQHHVDQAVRAGAPCAVAVGGWGVSMGSGVKSLYQ